MLKALTYSLAGACLLMPIAAQAQAPVHASVIGHVYDIASHAPVPGASISVEGGTALALSDSAGGYRLPALPGPQVLLARRVGFALARLPITVPVSGFVAQDIEMAQVGLRLEEIQVTADVAGRARGELGTATVINRDAIANSGAASLAGVLELTPGVPLQAPGLDNVQQISLRTAPTTSGDATRVNSFGTLIILDGVPVSNNANLQTTGSRGDIVLPTSAGGGVDLRRIPAASVERIEVIRGVPSARYGDLTEGAIIVDTRAGLGPSDVLARYDPRTIEGSLGKSAQWGIGDVAGTADLASTRLSPGLSSANVWRGTLNLSHHMGTRGDVGATGERRSIDSRLNLYQLYENDPERPTRPGFFASDRSGGLRLSQHDRWGRPSSSHLEITAAADGQWQNTLRQELLVRGAEPFTDRLDSGRSIGHYVGGAYPALVRLVGQPYALYARIEQVIPSHRPVGDNTLRIGSELRREWNAGAGYQFDIEYPPQVSFNGVNGYDRPRRYDAIPPMALSDVYIDDRLLRALPGGWFADAQAGLRVDALHRDSWWWSRSRATVVQPRANLQLAPRSWLRLRTAWGLTAKVPSLGDLNPAPQYFDVVNVNWYPPDPAERLAVLTTSIIDPINHTLGFAVTHKGEAGLEVDLGRNGAALALTVFRDVTTGAVTPVDEPSDLLREHFALTDSTVGAGMPPDFVTPAEAVDTVPVFVQRPENVDRILNRGAELTISLPEIAAIRTRLEMQGAWVVSRRTNSAVDFGISNRLSDFQLDSSRMRAPYWVGLSERGERALTTARLVHHQPQLGLIITGTVEYFIKETTVQEAATDTLAWAGYVTRSGTLMPVSPGQRGDSQYADLRTPRFGLLLEPASPLPDWLLSLQVAKTIFGEGRFAFYAFNALDRAGRQTTVTRAGRPFTPMRFGVELTLPTSVLWAR